MLHTKFQILTMSSCGVLADKYFQTTKLSLSSLNRKLIGIIYINSGTIQLIVLKLHFIFQIILIVIILFVAIYICIRLYMVCSWRNVPILSLMCSSLCFVYYCFNAYYAVLYNVHFQQSKNIP